MANFVWLRYGDKLPAVGVAQHLLRRAGADIRADGIYGPKTTAAVRAFQSRRSLASDGVIGRNTWPRLRASARLPIIDCIDVFDFDMFDAEVDPLKKAGINPILIGGMSNGIEQAVTEILSRANGPLFLVRMHGHGAPGGAGTSAGDWSLGDHRSVLKDSPATRRALSRLRGAFGPYGCIQFMHCSVAQGPRGAAFLDMVAQTVGVPATAATAVQYSGDLRLTMRFEGTTRTRCPGATPLRKWAESRPAFPAMSVA